MAKVSSSFRCMVCNQSLAFPENAQIVDFIILLLQFYKTHDACEASAADLPAKPAVSSQKVRRKKKR